MNTLNHAIGLYRKSKKVAVKVIFANGNSLVTEINGTFQDAKDYYLGKYFNVGIYPIEQMSKAVEVVELRT